jgi:hypothetical protein
VIASDPLNFSVQFLEQNQLIRQSCRRPMSAIDAVDGLHRRMSAMDAGAVKAPRFGEASHAKTQLPWLTVLLARRPAKVVAIAGQQARQNQVAVTNRDL